MLSSTNRRLEKNVVSLRNFRNLRRHLRKTCTMAIEKSRRTRFTALCAASQLERETIDLHSIMIGTILLLSNNFDKHKMTSNSFNDHITIRVTIKFLSVQSLHRSKPSIRTPSRWYSDQVLAEYWRRSSCNL